MYDNLGLVKNSIATIITKVAVLVLGIVSSVIIARILGPSGKGVLALILLVPGLAVSFGNLGLGVANVYYSGKEPEKINLLVTHSVLIGFFLGILLFVVCFLTINHSTSFTKVSHEINPIYFILALSILPFSLITGYFDQIVWGRNLILTINLKQVITTIASLASIVLFLIILKLNVLGAVLSNICIGVISFLYSYFLVKRLTKIKIRASAVDWGFLKKSLAFGFKGYVGNLMSFLIYRLDMFLITFFLGTTQLGYYSLAVGLVEKIWLIPGSIAAVLLPRLTSTTKTEARKITPVVCRHTLLWVILAGLFMYFAAKPLINLLYGVAFAPSVLPLLILIPGILTVSMGKVLASDILSKGKPHYAMMLAFVAFIVNVVLNIILIPRWGIAGAAFASTVSYSLATVIWFWVYHRESGVNLSTLFVPTREDYKLYLGLLLRFKLFPNSWIR
ncbi:lipid II flippase MurJ [subsurface metagenome]